MGNDWGGWWVARTVGTFSAVVIMKWGLHIHACPGLSRPPVLGSVLDTAGGGN